MQDNKNALKTQNSKNSYKIGDFYGRISTLSGIVNFKIQNIGVPKQYVRLCGSK